jgi:hypothetical protein
MHDRASPAVPHPGRCLPTATVLLPGGPPPGTDQSPDRLAPPCPTPRRLARRARKCGPLLPQQTSPLAAGGRVGDAHAVGGERLLDPCLTSPDPVPLQEPLA